MVNPIDQTIDGDDKANPEKKAQRNCLSWISHLASGIAEPFKACMGKKTIINAAITLVIELRAVTGSNFWARPLSRPRLRIRPPTTKINGPQNFKSGCQFLKGARPFKADDIQKSEN